MQDLLDCRALFDYRALFFRLRNIQRRIVDASLQSKHRTRTTIIQRASTLSVVG